MNTLNSKRVLLLVVGVIIVIIVLITFATLANKTNHSVDNTSLSKEQIATTVDTTLKENLEVKDYEKSNDYYLNKISNITPMDERTIRVHIDDTLTDDRAKTIGWSVFGYVGIEITQLQTIVVQDKNGKDTNIFRDDVPSLNK